MTTVEGVEVSEEEQDGLESLVDSLLEEEVVATLVHNLDRIDEAAPAAATATSARTPEAVAVHNTLGEGG